MVVPYVTGPAEEGYCEKIVFLHLAAINTVDQGVWINRNYNMNTAAHVEEEEDIVY
jgi:hypothetical protein